MLDNCLLLPVLIALGLCLIITSDAEAAEDQFHIKSYSLQRLVESVPTILKDQDKKTGRFGKGIWIVTDQNVIFPLAAAWAYKSDANPYYHDPKVLEAVMAGGDALIADADKNGQWEFRKKDGSTWGQIYMPWTYSRWMRAYSLIRDGMPTDRREKWEKALLLGYTGISAKELKRVHNIPATHASALYLAGQVFEKLEWCKQAAEFMARVVVEQDPGGYWSEHSGPVVGYNFVYTDALGLYYAYSRDESVIPALEHAARFHANFTYPNGSAVETVDERQVYHSGVAFGNVGFTFTSTGRGFLEQQISILRSAKKPVNADSCAAFLLYGEEGDATPTAAGDKDRRFILGSGDALIRRKGPWFYCLSAFTCPISTSRWIQDRQNLVSIYHDKTGLIIGGGNTKLQPLWSSFTVGDTSLLQHRKGDISPDFKQRAGLFHIPDAASIKQTDPAALILKYGDEQCEIEVDPVDDKSVRISMRSTASSGMPVEGHLIMLGRMDKPLKTKKGDKVTLGAEEFSLTSEESGGWIEHAGWRLSLPDGGKIVWPVLPHNQYRKDGSATAAEGRLVVCLPFGPDKQEHTLTLSVRR